MATLPYIQLYVSDYLADTQHLTAEEHGAYLLLIMNYWQTEKPIPQNRLQGVTRMFNDRWTSVKQNISEFFLEDENGSWFHERIQEDLEKVKSKSKQASDAGKKSAEIRALNREQNKVRSTDVKSSLSECSTIKEEREKKKEEREKIKEEDKEIVASKTSDIVSINLSESLKIAEYLYDKIIDINPTFKRPNFETWAKDIELAMRLDKRTATQLYECIDWIYSKDGQFWQRNVLSGKKLREKFDTMNMQASTSSKNNNVRVAQDWLSSKSASVDELSEVLNVGR